jgi:ABC-type multidrug transport system fused ATPase/permease subunit
MTMIPQDPVLFEGTLRYNLDPLGVKPDEELWDAIKAVGLLDSMQQKSPSPDAGAASSSGNDTESEVSTLAPSSVSVQVSDEPPRPATPSSLTPTLTAVSSTTSTSLTLDSHLAEQGSNFSLGQVSQQNTIV